MVTPPPHQEVFYTIINHALQYPEKPYCNPPSYMPPIPARKRPCKTMPHRLLFPVKYNVLHTPIAKPRCPYGIFVLVGMAESRSE